MLTPQEVSSHAFSKAMMGGYNMTAVDEFLDVLTDDYTALYKENAALKAKLKVLVEKVEEYRATEDSMRATLLTAQRMADTIVREAEAKRDQMLADAESMCSTALAQAEAGARQKAVEYQRELNAAETRLQQGQQELARFIAASRELCVKQLALLGELPEAEVAVAEPVVETAEEVSVSQVEEIEEKVLAAFAAEPAEEKPAAEEPAQNAVFTIYEEPAKTETAAEPKPETAKVEDFPIGNPFEDSLESTRRINLADLKFGRNYTGDEN